jgi:outer membrane murein-binding lipoprotein Lpp
MLQQAPDAASSDVPRVHAHCQNLGEDVLGVMASGADGAGQAARANDGMKQQAQPIPGFDDVTFWMVFVLFHRR